MRQWTVDAFASEPFRGNPACVVEPFEDWPADAWMQSLAQENNQAETAFLKRRGPGEYDLRWFTPAVEVRLCGHATLAATHVLAAELQEAKAGVTFHTRSGPLSVTGAGGSYEMDFPADPPRALDHDEELQAALGVEIIEVWTGAYALAMLADQAAVEAVTPDLTAVRKAAGRLSGGRGDLIVTAKAEGQPYDVVSRFFAPGSGIPEDPTTGSAHCILAPLWSDRLGRSKLKYFQAFPGRGGHLAAEHRGDRVLLTERAVTVIESRLRT